MTIAGGIMIAGALVLLWIAHIAVVVLAAVILALWGSTIISGARKATLLACPACRRSLPR